MIYLLILIILFAFISAKYDYIRIKHNYKINHIHNWIFRALFATILMLIYDSNIFIILFIIPFLFSLSFRALLNKFRGKKINYISNSNKYDSIFIKLFKNKGGYVIYLFEIIMIIIGFLKIYN